VTLSSLIAGSFALHKLSDVPAFAQSAHKSNLAGFHRAPPRV
jgi:hypothetical protein